MSRIQASRSPWARSTSLVCFLVLLAGGLWLAKVHLGGALLHKKRLDRPYPIEELIEIPDGPLALGAGVLEKLLKARIDDAVDLYGFDLSSAETELAAHPLIAWVRIWRCPPGSLTIRYRLHTPIAQLTEWPQLALDNGGQILPIRSALTPKRLPKLNVGLPPNSEAAVQTLIWGSTRAKLAGARARLGLEILNCASALGERITSLDVSRAFAIDLGERRLELVLEEEIFLDGKAMVCHRKLLLSVEKWREQLQRYRRLLMKLAGEELRAVLGRGQLSRAILTEEIDLRLANLAYIAFEWVEAPVGDLTLQNR